MKVEFGRKKQQQAVAAVPHVEKKKKVLCPIFVLDRAEIQSWIFLNKIKPKDGLCSAVFHPREQTRL